MKKVLRTLYGEKMALFFSKKAFISDFTIIFSEKKT